MKAFQASNDVSQELKGSFSSSLNGCQQSTLWIANREETPITAITIHEREATLILNVYISDIHLVNLKLEITPETVQIQGQPTEMAGVEGYFRPSGFASLIPLPHPVEPETFLAKIQPDGVTIQLAKQLSNQPSKLWIELPTANSLDCSRMCV